MNVINACASHNNLLTFVKYSHSTCTMKKLLLAASALALTFGACTKKESTVLPAPVTDTVYVDSGKAHRIDTSVIISGLSDLRLLNIAHGSLNVSVMRTSGLEQKVAMSISGLPKNAIAKWSAPSGYTSFNTGLDIKTHFVKSGVYPLVISSITEKGKTKDYAVNLIVDSFTKKECQQFISNRLSAAAVTDPFLDSVVATFTSLTQDAAKGQLYLRNVILDYSTTPSQNFLSYNPTNGSFHVKITFDCEDGSFTIPSQTVWGRTTTGTLREYTIAGKGTVDAANGTYTITYATEHLDSGATIVKTYSMEGTFYN